MQENGEHAACTHFYVKKELHAKLWGYLCSKIPLCKSYTQISD